MSLSAAENKVRKQREMLARNGNRGSSKEDKVTFIFDSFFNRLVQPKVEELDAWMDENYYLPSESASEHGQWRTRRFPFLRKPAQKLSPTSRCKEIGACKGAQIGFTTLFVGWKLYIADMALGPTLYVQPTKEAIIEYSEQKLQPAIDLCKKVQDKLGDRRPKHLAVTKLRKYFPGGFISLGSANSAPTLRSKSIRNLMIDEEDGCNQDVNNEGSSVHLAIRRTANFANSKIARISTPIIFETSSIEPFCNTGTAERYLLPCPHCNSKADKYGAYFEIDWDYIRYTNKDHRTAVLVCPVNGCVIEEHHKTWMMDYEQAFYYRFNPTAKVEFENDDKRVEILIYLAKHGYHELNREQIDYLDMTSIPDEDEEIFTCFVSSLYSPLGFYSWQEAAKLFIEANAKRDKTLLKTFYNTVLGKSWRVTGNGIDHKGLSSRKELYSHDGSFDVPFDALVISAGVDVQGDRLEMTVKATGLNGEQWLLDYKIFDGDTSIYGDAVTYRYNGHLTCWGLLDEYLRVTFTHETGRIMPIECTLIDARYRSPQVFKFCKAHEKQRVRGVYGQDGWGEGLIKRPKKRNRSGVIVYSAMQDELKYELYANLRIEDFGPNFIHFSRTIDYPTNYFPGLVIEELKTKRKGDTDVMYWENPPGGRNEPTDTWNYATVAFLAIRIDLKARAKALQAPLGVYEKPAQPKQLRLEQVPDEKPKPKPKPKKKLVKKTNKGK